MRKKLLMKSLLVAAALCVGGNAWADSKVTFYSNDFSAANSLDLISVSATANQTLELGTEDGRGNYVRQTTEDRGRDMYMNLTSLLSESFADYTDYVVEFDAAFKSGATNRTTGNKLYLPSTGSSNIFYMATPSEQVANGDLVFTVTGAGEGKEITLKALTWYHFKFEITASKVTYTVTLASNGSAVTNGNGTLAITDSRIKQIYFGTARNTGQSRLDNVDIYTMVAGDVANDPIVTETAVQNENRQYTITFGEGETLHYTLPGGTEQTTTESPLVVTVTAAGTLSAYTTKGTATSATVSKEVTHGAITLNNPTYSLSSIGDGFAKTYTINVNNSSVELQPTASMSYVFTPAGGSAEEAVAIVNGGKISATAEGTYVITATADGYTSSKLTINNNQAYTKTQTYDFAALTVADLDLTTPKWTGPATTNYQTGSSSTLFSADGYTVVSEYASNSAIEGVNLNSATVLMIGRGLHPNGSSGGFTVANANSDDYVLWSYYDYGNVVEAVYNYNTAFKGNGNHWRYLVTKVEVYSPSKSVDITSAGWATLYTDKALDFSGVEGLTAYTASLSGSTVTLTAVDNVPANTGVVLKGDAKTYSIPAIASSTTDKGDLEGSTTDVDVTADAENVYYVLAKSGDADARFAKVSTGSIAAGKAYLKVAKTAAREFFAIGGDDVTAIESVKAQQMNGEVYNLNGQRIVAPQKGLYIVNGKKVVLK